MDFQEQCAEWLRYFAEQDRAYKLIMGMDLEEGSRRINKEKIYLN